MLSLTKEERKESKSSRSREAILFIVLPPKGLMGGSFQQIAGSIYSTLTHV